MVTRIMIMRPKDWSATALAELKRSADDRVARQARKYFKPFEKVHVLGVSTPALRLLEKNLFQQIALEWSVEEAVACCDILIRNRFLEAKGVGILLLGRYKKAFKQSLLDKVEAWLRGGFCDNWASCDVLAGTVIAPMIGMHAALLSRLKVWALEDGLWLRRAAAVSLTPLARKGKCLDEAYEIASSLLPGREDLIHKAVGWLLREAGKTDRPRLETYLLSRGPQIPRTALRYAIEKLPPERRKLLMSATR